MASELPGVFRLDKGSGVLSPTWPDVALDEARPVTVAQARRLLHAREALAAPIAEGRARWAYVLTDDGVLLSQPGSAWPASRDRDRRWASTATERPTWSLGITDHHGVGQQVLCAVRWPAAEGVPGGVVAGEWRGEEPRADAANTVPEAQYVYV